TLVVTATRTPTPVRELLNDISVITQEDIQRAGQTTLPELLRSLPGIEFSANGGAGTNSSVFIRGANANHTLVLIDGMRINSATTGTTALEKIPLGQIEHIEVLRGPGSHLYGSEAIGGVIQIFTKSGGAAPGFHLGGGAGSRGLYQVNAGGNGKLGGVNFNLEIAHESTDSFSAIGDTTSSTYNPDNDPYRNTSASAKLSHRLNDQHEFGATGFYSNGKGHFDGSRTYDSRNNQTLAAYGFYSQDRFLPDWKSQIRIGRSFDDLRSLTSTSWTKFRTDQEQLSWQNDLETGVGRFTLGTEHNRQHVTSTTSYTVSKRAVHSYFAGYQGRFGAHSTQLNVRNDDNSQFGSHATGSAAYGYQFTKAWRANASIGTAFRAPTFNELYFPNYGISTLRPERAVNKEAGVHFDHAAQHVSLVYFDNQISDLINSGTVVSQTQRASITGATLSYHGRVDNFNLRASATAQNPRNETNNLLLNRRAKQTATAGIDYQSGAWSYGGELNASGKRYDDANNTKPLGGYTVFNLHSGYTYSKALSFVARLNNVFDKQYELAKTYNTPDRNIFVGFDYHPK
ncbi:MAG: TonB-dependent receptor, partial [Burkholderiales bacterium]|nr:TonB-dependent receptor [Burkholderiales bacterium]